MSALRLLHVINRVTPSGGAEVSLAQMAPALAARGVEQGLVTLLPTTAPSVLARLEDAGVRHFDAGGASARVAVPHLVRVVRAFAPDVMAACLFESSRAAWFAGAQTRTPVLCSIVNTPYDPAAMAAAPSRHKLALLARLDALATRHLTTHVHTLTQATARDVQERCGLDPERISVVPRGRSRQELGLPGPQRRQNVRASHGLAEDQFVVLNVGRQERQKGQTLLVTAFEQLAATDPRARLLIAGRPGAASRDLRRAVAASPAQAQIEVLGFRADVPDLLCAADLFVFSSLWEGLGGSVLEAMAMQVPVLAFDVPAVAEVLAGTGELVPKGDADALGRAMCVLASDGPRRRRVAALGRQRFDAAYELDAIIPRMEQMYRDVGRTGWSRAGARSRAATAR